MLKKPRFIDLFAGIGGFRLGFEQVGYQCVFSSEINSECQIVYQKNFNEQPFDDVTQINPKKLPNFEILLAGFPCQPFSISGQKNGFYDTRGTLFFDICRIIEEKQPPVVVLENVKHLIHIEKGNTFKVIIQTLEELGYKVSYKVLNANDFGVPQNRERIIIVGTKSNNTFDFEKIPKQPRVQLQDFLDNENTQFEYLEPHEYTILDNYTVQKTGLIFIGYRNKQIWKKGIRPNTEHLSRVHRQPNRIYSVEGPHPTIPSQEVSGRFFIYLPNENKVRKLTINECYRIMGFPENFIKSEKVGERYKQIGNSVCVPMIAEIAKQIKEQDIMTIEHNSKENFRNFCLTAKEYNNINQLTELQTLINTALGSNTVEHYSKTIIENVFKQKGVFTVLTTLLFYKIENPSQDIRYHQTELSTDNIQGFSGRSFDTKNITPILKELELPSMAESGWLTRSLEQPYIYDLDYQGKISNKVVKTAFLSLIYAVEEMNIDPKSILLFIIHGVYQKSLENQIQITKLANPDLLTISNMVDILTEQFNYNYEVSGGAKLPMLAFHAIYQILLEEMAKYQGCYLMDIGSYTASDKTSRTAGDLEIFYQDTNKLKEAVEIKLGVTVDLNMLLRAKGKIIAFNPERYYILSTSEIKTSDISEIERNIEDIRKNHGCQIIINGVIDTLKYYFRLIANLEKFIEIYSHLIEKDSELKKVHKLYWNDKVIALNEI